MNAERESGEEKSWDCLVGKIATFPAVINTIILPFWRDLQVY